MTVPPITDEAQASTSPTSHLTPPRWAAANRHLICKAIAEFSHERILAPEPDGPGTYFLLADDGTRYRFDARRRRLDHWSIDAASLTRTRDGRIAPPDALKFILHFRDSLGISDAMLPTYLEEISATISGHAYKGVPAPAREAIGSDTTGSEAAGPEDALVARPDAATLAAALTDGADPAAGFQAVESAMSEGHPCFVANNGRTGFGINDYHAFAPETGAAVRLEWIAVHDGYATFTALTSLDYRSHLAAELGDGCLAEFEARIAAFGADPRRYLLMPVHPWQWDRKITVTFAAEIAAGRIIHLGRGLDDYQAQQSIRTFFNRSAPSRCYVKTALSVINMGFMRGLSAAYMRDTPAINEWLGTLVASDATLSSFGFDVLREVAAIGYRNPYYEAATDAGSAYRKMLAALWRESPLPRLRPGQHAATMASMLHRDADGRALVTALIERSGVDPSDWLTAYLRAYLVPILHSFYRYQLVYMPHGENIILILSGGIVDRVLLKDIGEEIAVFDSPTGVADSLPPGVDRIRVDVPEQERALSIFTDVFDCFFRFLAAILADDGVVDEDEFWQAVAAVVVEYQASHPELSDEFAQYDLFADEFARSCLNRLQLRDNRQMLDLDDPSAGLQKSGTLANPLAPYRPRPRDC